MSTSEQKTLLQQQLEELIKVGVGGKFRNQNNEDYVKKIEEEIAFEEEPVRSHHGSKLRRAIRTNPLALTQKG